MEPRIVLGVDFDNTIADYVDVLHRLAMERRLITEDVAKDRLEIRRRIRELPEGPIEWQEIQGAIYGPYMHQAKLACGVGLFLKAFKEPEREAHIVSHKTTHSAYDQTGTNLREAALGWMDQHRFFDPDGMGLDRTNVYFEPTRQCKIRRIMRLGCTHVIDDLEETFQDGSFPSHMVKILYAPNGTTSVIPGVKAMRTWSEIGDHVFNKIN